MTTHKKLFYGISGGIIILIILMVGLFLFNRITATTISGYVISGGDTTPKGLYDTPRGFVYKIETDDGSFIDVAYTAYPPSPVGDREGKKISLRFHAGTIKVGDYLKARGTYNKDTNILTVADGGDYIETYPKKP